MAGHGTYQAERGAAYEVARHGFLRETSEERVELLPDWAHVVGGALRMRRRRSWGWVIRNKHSGGRSRVRLLQSVGAVVLPKSMVPKS